MSGMTIAEKIIASHASKSRVSVGELVTTSVDCAVILDLNLYEGHWLEPRKVFDPDKVVMVFDHVVPPPTVRVTNALQLGRDFASKQGITKIHDIGPEQGICHQLIADVPYILPGEILVCCDSHTCSAGALNGIGRGLGEIELIYALATGQTWFRVAPTIRYEFVGSLRHGVEAKDVFLHIAQRFGDHVGSSVEFGGSGLASLTITQRRTIAAMCAEISAEFVVFEFDDTVARFLASRGRVAEGVWPDPDAVYAEVRTVDLGDVEAMVAGPHHVVGSSMPAREVAGTAINRAFIGSCANGTLEDLHQAADVLRGRHVDRRVQLIVTPASQSIYRTALDDGTLHDLAEAGAIVTTPSCSMCAGHINALGSNDVCVSSSTRNFRGRMGSSTAEIYLGSSRTVALAALNGHIGASGEGRA
jgi:3-isopropylmalate/(R)-2-methylmalate dehydratase large subunit